MSKDMFIITGMIDEINEKARKLDRELWKAEDEDNVDFEKLEELASEIEDASNNLISELDSELV
ncbi:hypothetical protein [Virgibacillus salexigens]|uniref:Uncharacterized protein n=1 Tax=Virgibacillus massiliensis TaxID=1462526 RepID=A0A024QIV7_9BACI|nr:hypothetical protein [Virgibacillus massiliensis]CDQ41886.1 hypothetical protein BN990_04265 [Virgibacillus massiliensis]